MEIIAPILGTLNHLWNSIACQIGYVRSLSMNIEKLEKEAGYLFAEREDMRQKISSDTVKMTATNACNYWLKNVDDTENQVNIILEIYKDDKKCLAGWCPNVYFRMKLGKRVQNIIENITNLNEKLSTIKGGELVDAPLETIEPQFAPKIEVNTSTDRTLQKLLECIRDVKIQKIGIWGMGGIGKTTVMKLLNGQPEISIMFEIIIWVTVSKEGNRRTVQNDIAERLNLALSNESDNRIQAKICQNLSPKRFLLLLDDIWKRIDLSDVGIPDLIQENGCKVVLTTRSLNICNQMDTDKEIKVDTLTEYEAWSLFHEKVGAVVMSHDIEPYARSIVKECDGLPLAIIAVGSALKRKNDVIVWKSALSELQSPAASQIDIMEELVFQCLRFSYDQLQDDCKRKLFLYCALYPEDYGISISELAEYCWIEGFLDGVGSIAKARDKGHRLIIDLIDASLLENIYDNKYVKMHDIVRDLALRITSLKGEGSRFLVRVGKRAVDLLEEKEWEKSEKISLMRSELCSLPRRPYCPNLSALFLQADNDPDTILSIPDSFFECMPALRLLDLSGRRMKSLPSSLWCLVNLRGLYLRNCIELADFPSKVRELKELEVLDLGGYTEIEYLPSEVGELTRLKRLVVAFKMDYGIKEWNRKLRIPSGIISRLPLLEELSMFVYKNGLHEEHQWDNECMEAVVDELCSLERLTYLDFYFPKEECLQHFLQRSRPWKAKRLMRFRFRVGSCRTRNFKWENVELEIEVEERCLIKKGAGNDGISHVSIGEALGQCGKFYLEGDGTAQKLSEVGMENMNELKICWINNCDMMETLHIDDGDNVSPALLPNLEELYLYGLPNWRSLWVGPLPLGSLSRLTRLGLHECHNSKKAAFSCCIIRHLFSLESLEVSGCRALEEIIGVNDEEDGISVHDHQDTIILPNLKSIWLNDLPELVSICRGVSSEWPSLKKIYIFDCPKVNTLCFISNAAPNLKRIEAQEEWWETLQWEDNVIEQRLQPIFCSI